jgi:predicted ATPase
LIEMIAAKQLLLVLENFEHLMDGVDLLVEVLRQAPKVLLLVTSRERLNLQTEDLFELQGLPTPVSTTDAEASHFAAVRLFVDRAHRLDKHFKLSAEQLPHVVRICQLVEGFPLAIELAATWIRDLNCGEIVAELVEGLDRLETTARDMAPQHRSLRAVFNASWRLLSTAERRALAKLAVFRGGFHAEAARSVADASPALLSALRNKSLLRHAGSRRYDMHALVHQFSAEALATDRQEKARTQGAHSQYFMTLLAEQAIALDTRDAGVAGAKIQLDWENVTIAWQQATAQADLYLLQNALDGLFRFCDLRGLYPEAQTLFEGTVARLETPFTPPLPTPPQPGEGDCEWTEE